LASASWRTHHWIVPRRYFVEAHQPSPRPGVCRAFTSVHSQKLSRGECKFFVQFSMHHFVCATTRALINGPKRRKSASERRVCTLLGARVVEYAKLLKLNPDGGGVATREVITWATNDIVSQTKNIAWPQRALKSLSTDALQARAEAARGGELQETIVRRTNLKPPNSTMYCIALWPTGASCSIVWRGWRVSEKPTWSIVLRMSSNGDPDVTHDLVCPCLSDRSGPDAGDAREEERVPSSKAALEPGDRGAEGTRPIRFSNGHTRVLVPGYLLHKTFSRPNVLSIFDKKL
jgi:hypothetical protein